MYKPKKIRNRSYAIENTKNGECLKWDDGGLKIWGAKKFALRKSLALNVEAGYIDDVVFPPKREYKLFKHNYCVHWSLMKAGLNDIVPKDRTVFDNELFEIFALPYSKTLKLQYRDDDISHSGMTLMKLKTMGGFMEGDYIVTVGRHCLYLSDGVLYDSDKRGWDMRRIDRIWRIERSKK